MPAVAGIARAIESIDRAIIGSCRWATVLLMAAIAVVISVGVFFRYVLNDSLSWTEEIAKYLLVWLAFVGSPLALRHGGHIAVEVLPNLLPARPRHLLHCLIFATVAAVTALLAAYGYDLALNASGQRAATVDISLLWMMLAVPVGSGVMTWVAIGQALAAGRCAVEPRAPSPSTPPTGGGGSAG